MMYDRASGTPIPLGTINSCRHHPLLPPPHAPPEFHWNLLPFKVHAHPGEQSPVSLAIYPPLQSFSGSSPKKGFCYGEVGDSRNLWTPEMMGDGARCKGEMEEKGLAWRSRPDSVFLVLGLGESLL